MQSSPVVVHRLEVLIIIHTYVLEKAWLIGWSLILEYTISASAVARGVSPNLALFFGGEEGLPNFLARHTIPGLGIVVDPCAAILIFIVTALLCIGIRESVLAQTIVTSVNICAMLFVIIAGGYLCFRTGWVGYNLSSGYFPFGTNGMLAGSAVVFFSYIGFDTITSTTEEVKNPKRDVPLGIGISLSVCCALYMLISIVILGLVPYYSMDLDTPISSAFADYGMDWAVYIVTMGALTALCATLMGSILPQPRILMAMARDGLLPSFFSEINKKTHVPVMSTIATGIFAATLAFCMDVSQLAGMVSVGTLLAFTTVAISVLIIRYVPPTEIALPSSHSESVGSGSDDFLGIHLTSSNYPPENYVSGSPLLMDEQKECVQDKQNQQRKQKVATLSIFFICLGALVLASAASVENLPSLASFTLYFVGGVVLVCSLIILVCIDQDESKLSFGQTGGFTCPFVPFLPAACILINTYLLLNLGTGAWTRVSVWLAAGVLVYVFYGHSHSSLSKASRASAAAVDVHCPLLADQP
uniref:Cationic amino acid transporter C-terminal domain-containing protein n=1 Tax=Kalanchoe fedtschenkoi TaxID=63787 RepID=A0A7N0V1N0_KALFE